MEDLKSIKEKEYINAQRTALVVIDLQMGIANKERPASPFTYDQVIKNASSLVKTFTEKGAFVVLVKVSSLDGKDMLKPNTDVVIKTNLSSLPKGFDSFVPELSNVKNAHHIIKRQWGAFYGTDLDLQLRRRGIDTIVLCGVSTNIGVDTTAREAFQHGYNQIFSTDAMTASTKEEHDFECKYIFPRIGKLRTTQEIVSLIR
ncbi:isochorismatase family protein [Clostridium estertheticum]|uniref:Isochorismatase family protein n=1 Tax=Clostridium estertheticum TaxID=238834 RepID=A0AA47I5U6_9CLOT|nr:isochorismatase family protein [Clostridium estertheticum]MBU3155753.1 isochorismatase family protein [Clostridium estertheticum]MBU3201162.1 isochorismatase family protein [Clostridium estertheticum]WAG59105.1 isochorismatase family protein [Clostridium estertheticum]WAG66844.1 isochorismatase family protein [Clostridium estertheticum]